MNITELIKEAYQNAVEKGFHKNKQNISELLMLIVTELGEACEALRKNKKTVNDAAIIHPLDLKYFEIFVKDTFEDEIADCFIRLADLCGYLDIDIEKHIIAKMEYNKTREKKHGKEF